MFFFLKSPGSRCFDTAQLFVLIGFCVVEFKSNHSNTKASQKIMTLDFQFMDQKSQTWQAQTIMTSRFLQFKPQQNHQKSITKQQIPSWLIHWKIKPQNIHRFINLTYWKKTTNAQVSKACVSFFHDLLQKIYGKIPLWATSIPCWLFFHASFFLVCEIIPINWAPQKKTSTSRCLREPHGFAHQPFGAPKHVIKGAMTSELTNGWIRNERMDQRFGKKNRRSVTGGSMVIVWGDCCCFDECNVWEWKVSGRPVGTVDRCLWFIYLKTKQWSG